MLKQGPITAAAIEAAIWEIASQVPIDKRRETATGRGSVALSQFPQDIRREIILTVLAALYTVRKGTTELQLGE